MKRQSILMTTHIDLHNQRFAKEALEQVAREVNQGSRPYLTIEHDITIPPYGKMLEAWVEQREDGEYQLVETSEIFENALWTKLPDETVLFKEESETDRNPFANRYPDVSVDYEVAYDPINFETKQHTAEFVQAIKDGSGVDFVEKHFGRKSAIPDPELIIKIAETVATFLVAHKAIDKAGDKIVELSAEEVGKFYNFVKSTAFSAAKYAIPKNRPITYVFVVAEEPSVEFVVRSNNPNLVLSSVLLEKLKTSVERAEELHKLFSATRIQFILNESGEWEFNYLLTDKGAVVGTDRAYARRLRKFELLLPDIQENQGQEDQQREEEVRKAQSEKPNNRKRKRRR